VLCNDLGSSCCFNRIAKLLGNSILKWQFSSYMFTSKSRMANWKTPIYMVQPTCCPLTVGTTVQQLHDSSGIQLLFSPLSCRMVVVPADQEMHKSDKSELALFTPTYHYVQDGFYTHSSFATHETWQSCMAVLKYIGLWNHGWSGHKTK